MASTCGEKLGSVPTRASTAWCRSAAAAAARVVPRQHRQALGCGSRWEADVEHGGLVSAERRFVGPDRTSSSDEPRYHRQQRTRMSRRKMMMASGCGQSAPRMAPFALEQARRRPISSSSSSQGGSEAASTSRLWIPHDDDGSAASCQRWRLALPVQLSSWAHRTAVHPSERGPASCARG